MALLALLAVGAFVLGSIPFGVLVGRAVGVDVRGAGSGNIGATNVARTAGRGAGLATLALDALKGAAPVALGRALDIDPSGLALIGLLAVLGHVFSPFLRFRGGKGVATAAGVFAVLTPWSLGGALVAFALVFAGARIVSLGSLVAVVTLLALSVLRGDAPAIVGLAGGVAVLVFVRHAGNLRRLLRGEEPRFGAKPP